MRKTSAKPASVEAERNDVNERELNEFLERAAADNKISLRY